MAELNWTSVSDFNPEHFPDGEFFLVWILPEGEEGFAQIGQWEHEYDDEGKSDGEKRITGEWRHTDIFQGLDAVAFAAIPAPSEELLRLAA
jgi:hypothetical protein